MYLRPCWKRPRERRRPELPSGAAASEAVVCVAAQLGDADLVGVAAAAAAVHALQPPAAVGPNEPAGLDESQ